MQEGIVSMVQDFNNWLSVGDHMFLEQAHTQLAPTHGKGYSML
jgi:hypothetical protein